MDGPAVWITGTGAVSPFGHGVASLWSGLLSGEPAIGSVGCFDATRHTTRIAGEVELTEPRRREGRTDSHARAAAREAAGAPGAIGTPGAPGVLGASLANTGVFWGTSTGGMLEGERFWWDEQGPRRGRKAVAPLAAQPPGAPAASVARELGCGGPVTTFASACAASTMALEAALCALRRGEVAIAIAGGSDGLCELTYGGFNALRAVDAQPARPFRADRAGLSIGEGAGALLLETEDHARAHGRAALAVLAGAWSTCDAHHMTAPRPDGGGAAAAVRGALRDAGASPADVAFVSAHGTGTTHNDPAEWQALATVLGERARNVPVMANKGAVGHLLGACGALEAVVVVQALVERRLPPTPGGGPVDPETPVDLVLGDVRELPGGSRERARLGLSLNLAFGGANAAIVVAPAAREIGR